MNKNGKNLKSYKIFYTISTIIIALIFIITGIGNILPFQHISNDMTDLGYPAYFLKILGFWKILGGVAVAVPIPGRYKDFAYTGMILDLTGAAMSHYFVGDDFKKIMTPVLISIVVTLNYVVRNKTHRIIESIN
jgi:uncharacterized membrane protein YphA (DoxX/SURF4 family)